MTATVLCAVGRDPRGADRRARAMPPSTNQPTNKENIMSEAAKVITVDGVEYRQAAA